MSLTRNSTDHSPDSTKSPNWGELIENRLRTLRTRILQTDLLTAMAGQLACLVGYLLIFTIFDQWIASDGVTKGTRWFLFLLVSCSLSAWIIWKQVLPIMRQVSTLYAARRVESVFPEIQGGLLAWVDFQQSGRKISPAIQQAIAQQTVKRIENLDLTQAVDPVPFKQTLRLLLLLTSMLFLYSVVTPKSVIPSLWRGLVPFSDVAVATQTQIVSVSPGTIELLSGQPLQFDVQLSGRIPTDVIARLTTADQRLLAKTIRLEPDSEDPRRFLGSYEDHPGAGLQGDLSYNIVAGDVTSTTFDVKVFPVPAVQLEQVSYQYPNYTQQQSRTQSHGDIEAIEGTIVSVQASATSEIQKARIICFDNERNKQIVETHPVTIRNGQLQAEWRLKFQDDGTYPRCYAFEVFDQLNQTNPHPVIHRIRIQRDLPPVVNLEHSQRSSQVPANAVVPLLVSAHDADYQLRRVTLHVEKNGVAVSRGVVMQAAPPDFANFQQIYQLDLNQISPSSGDRINVFAEAEDNLTPFENRQANVSRSSRIPLTIRTPVAPAQVRHELQNQQKQLEEIASVDSQNSQEKHQQRPKLPADPFEESLASRDPLAETDQRDASPLMNSPQNGSSREPSKNHPPEDRHPPSTQQEQNSTTEKSTTETGTENASSSSADEPASNSDPSPHQPRQEKAEEDEALRKLVEWSRNQDQASSQQQNSLSSQSQQSSNQNNAEGDHHSDSDATGERSADSQNNQQSAGQSSGSSAASDNQDAASTPSDSGSENGQPHQPTNSTSPQAAQQASGSQGNDPSESQASSDMTKTSENSKTGDSRTSDSDHSSSDSSKNSQANALQNDASSQSTTGSPSSDNNAQSSGNDSGLNPGQSAEQTARPDQSSATEGHPHQTGATSESSSDLPSQQNGMGDDLASAPTLGAEQRNPMPSSSTQQTDSTDSADSDQSSSATHSLNGPEHSPLMNAPSNQNPPANTPPTQSAPEAGEGTGTDNGEFESKDSLEDKGSGTAAGIALENQSDKQSNSSRNDSSEENHPQGAVTDLPDEADPRQRPSSPSDERSQDLSAEILKLDELTTQDQARRVVRQAYEHVLQQIQTNGPPRELLDELGFSETDFMQFFDRLEQHVTDAGIDQSPEAAARRQQFDALLQGLTLPMPAHLKTEAGRPSQQSAPRSGRSARPVPPAYQLKTEDYLNRLHSSFSTNDQP